MHHDSEPKRLRRPGRDRRALTWQILLFMVQIAVVSVTLLYHSAKTGSGGFVVYQVF